MNSKNNVLLLLIAMTSTDGQTAVSEQQYILDLAAQMGVSSQEVIAMQSALKYFKLEVPKAEVERMQILYQLLFLMRIDRSIAAKEKALLRNIAVRLGVQPDLTEELIDIMEDHIAKKLPESSLLDAIKKYMN